MPNVTFTVYATQAAFETARDTSKTLVNGGLYFITDSKKIYRASGTDSAVDFTEPYEVVNSFPTASNARIGCLYINATTHEIKVKQTSSASALTTVVPPLNQIYVFKGSCTYAELTAKTTGNVIGDTWNVTTENTTDHIPAGTNYAWNGSAWDPLGGSVDLSNYLTTSSSINNLADVDTTGASNQYVLMYNGTSGKWEAQTIPSGVTTLAALSDVSVNSASTASNKFLVYSGTAGNEKWTASTVNVGDLSDVTITSVAANNVIKYDNGTSKWVNGTLSLGDMSNVTITSPAANQALTYNGTNWVNSVLPINAGNTNITSVADGQVLQYNSSSSKWVNVNANSLLTWTEVSSN